MLKPVLIGMTTRMSRPEGVVLRHLEHLRTVRNLRAQTVYDRQLVLWRLRCWAGQPILYLSADQLADWRRERPKQVSATTVAMELSGIREFYKWAVWEHFRDDDPTLRLARPRVPARRPRPISDKNLAVALHAADPGMLAVLALAGFAGFRAGEIAQLAWPDVNFPARTITIVDGKGGKSRLVSMSSVLAAILAALGPARCGPVIARLDGRGGHNPAHRISQRANTHLHSLGVGETLHQLRHRFGTAMYTACRDIRAVQDQMGHSSPATTALYVAVADAVTAAAVEAASVLAA
jgi:integrase/recombinase XerC